MYENKYLKYKNKYLQLKMIGGSNPKILKIPDKTESIPPNAFKENKTFTEVILPEGLKSIGDNAFANTDLQSVIIPLTVTTIGDGAFANNNNLNKVTMPLHFLKDKNIQTYFNEPIFKSIFGNNFSNICFTFI